MSTVKLLQLYPSWKRRNTWYRVSRRYYHDGYIIYVAYPEVHNGLLWQAVKCSAKLCHCTWSYDDPTLHRATQFTVYRLRMRWVSCGLYNAGRDLLAIACFLVFTSISYSIVDMELSSDVTNGLKLIADTSKIPEKYFVILLKNAINTLTESKRFEPPHGTLHFVCNS